MAEPTLRVGIVGCGSFGRHAYALNVADHPDASIVALCDVDRTRAVALAQDVGGKQNGQPLPEIYEDYTRMLDHETLDVVMVGTMADIRPQVTVAALDRGSHVLAAKPMAPTLAQAEQMLEAAERAKRLLMVGYNFRFRDDAQVIYRFIRGGGIGTPLFARAWSHEASIPTWGPHYRKAISGGGSLASTAVHAIDLAVWFLGSPRLVSVEGQVRSRFNVLPSLSGQLDAVRDTYDTEDLVSGYARFAGDVSLSIEAMWLTPRPIDNKGVDVWGTTGYASLVPLRLFAWQDGDYVERTEELAPGLAATFRDDSRLRARREVYHFLDCVLGRSTPLITTQEMWTDQAIVDGLYVESARYG